MKQILIISPIFLLFFFGIQSQDMPKYRIFVYEDLNITKKMRITPFGGFLIGSKGMSFIFLAKEYDEEFIFRMDLRTDDSLIYLFYKDYSGEKQEIKKLKWNFKGKKKSFAYAI